MALKNHIPFGPAPVGEPLLVHKTGEGASVVVRDNEPWTLWFTRLTAQTNDAMFNCCAQADRWTPEHTNKVNISASAPRLSQYSLTGNLVTFSGEFDATPTLPGIVTSFEMSLPVESSFGATGDAGGTAGAKAVAGQVAAIFANITNGTLQVQWVAGDTSSRTMNFSGSYWKINAAPPPYPPLHITTPCPTDEPVLDESYSYQFEATGGKKPYHWTAAGLPDGMTINEFTGILGGAPTESGTFSYTITVADSQVPPFTDSLDCEFVIAGETCVATTEEFDFIDALWVDETYIYVVDTEEPATLRKILRNTTGVVDSIVLPMDECDVIRTDATYIYVAGYIYPAGAQHVCRILKSDFTTIDDLVPGFATGRFFTDQGWIDGGYFYLVPAVSGAGPNGGGNVMRILLSDFTTVTTCSFDDGQPTWTKLNFSFVLDSSNIYVSCSLSGFAGPDVFEVFKIDKASFTQTDTLLITSANPGGSVPDLPGSLTQDSTDLYIKFSASGVPGRFNVGITRIAKSTFTEVTTQYYNSLGANPPFVVFDWLEASDPTYLYANTNEFPAKLMRITKADLSVYDFQTLTKDVGNTSIFEDPEFFIRCNGDGALIHLCEFVPD